MLVMPRSFTTFRMTKPFYILDERGGWVLVKHTNPPPRLTVSILLNRLTPLYPPGVLVKHMTGGKFRALFFGFESAIF